MKEFIEYLKKNKQASANTLLAYERDLNAFSAFLGQNRGKELSECTDSDAVAYVLELNNQNKSKSTINRKVSALRTFYEHKVNIGELAADPFSKVKTAKTDKRDIDYLTIEQAASLMELPDDSPRGLRDRALMEFMYGTGARVSEVVRLKIEDINLKMGFVALKDADDASRVVPLGSYARESLRKYIDNAYERLKGRPIQGGDHVFVNVRGDVLSRQGIWKMLREYGDRLGFGSRMTPQILRDTFAVHILQNGGDLKTLQELMGFDDMSVGIAYLAVTKIHVREVFARCHPRA